MVDQLTHAEQQKYSKMWDFSSYRERSPGMRHVNDALRQLRPAQGASFIDLGCGTGRVAHYLQVHGFNVTALDIAENACTEFTGPFVCSCLWELPGDLGKFDYGFCADVLEHIPTERVHQTLKAISQHVDTAYFQIANFICHEGDKIGEHLHLTVKPISWWDHAISQYFSVQYKQAARKHHIFTCKSRAF